MRRIAVVGADSTLGEIVLNRALAAGYEVHAFGKSLGRLAQRYNENLSAFHGDPATGEGLEPAVHGARFVVCALEPGEAALAALMAKLIPLLKAPPLGRLVFVSQWGAGDSARQKAEQSGRFARLTSWFRKDATGDFGQAEGLLRVSKLPYVILRPVSLIDDPTAREVVATEPTGKAPPPVARGALAKFIMEVLVEPGWDRREMTVGAFTDRSESGVFKRTRTSPVTTPGTPNPLFQKAAAHVPPLTASEPSTAPPSTAPPSAPPASAMPPNAPPPGTPEPPPATLPFDLDGPLLELDGPLLPPDAPASGPETPASAPGAPAAEPGESEDPAKKPK